MKILIIGGTGLIGDKILSNLNLKRHKVFSINRKKILHHPNITYFKLNYHKEFSKIKKIIEKYKFEVVINLICFNYSQAKRDFNLFKKYTTKYIFVSSTSVYKKTKKNITEKMRTEETKNLYISGKIKAENFFIRKTKNFPFIILRICQIYGNENIPTLFKKRSYSVLKDMFLNKRVYLFKSIKNKWKLLYANDLGKIITRIIESKNQKLIKNIFNIVPDKSHSWDNIYHIYCNLIQGEINKKNLNINKIRKLNKEMYDHLVLDKLKNANYDNKKIFRIIKKPKFTNFKNKITKIINKKREKILKTKQDKDILKIFKLASN